MIPLDYNTVLSPLFSWLSTNTELPKRKNWTSSKTNTSNNEEIGGEGDSILSDNEEEETSHVANSLNVFGYANTMIYLTSAESGRQQQNSTYHRGRGNGSTNYFGLLHAIDNFILGYKNIVSNKKARRIMKITEGKSPLAFNGFCAIANLFLTKVP